MLKKCAEEIESAFKMMFDERPSGNNLSANSESNTSCGYGSDG